MPYGPSVYRLGIGSSTIQYGTFKNNTISYIQEQYNMVHSRTIQ